MYLYLARRCRYRPIRLWSAVAVPSHSQLNTNDRVNWTLLNMMRRNNEIKIMNDGERRTNNRNGRRRAAVPEPEPAQGVVPNRNERDADDREPRVAQRDVPRLPCVHAGGGRGEEAGCGAVA